MKKLIWALLLAAALLGGCGRANEAEITIRGGVEPVVAVDAEQGLADLPVLTADWAKNLQPDMAASLTVPVTPELKKCFWDGARMEDWFHLPQFAEGNPPTEPIDYWCMLLAEGKTEISREEFDEFVRKHFGEVELQHRVDDGKYWRFDGDTYYACPEGESSPDYFDLQELMMERRADGKIVYTAKLNEYGFNYLNFFYYDEASSPAENLAEYQRMFVDRAAYDEIAPEEAAVLAAYGEQIADGTMTMDEAIYQMVLAGNTGEFPVVFEDTVTFYIDEETREPFYLAVAKADRRE